jgi:hypothetical protein
MAVTISYTPATFPITNSNGIINAGDCHVTQDTGSNMNVSISTGQAFIKGTFSHTGDPQVLTVANNTSGSTRYDLVVIHVDLVNDTADYRILTGNLNPTQSDTVWELPLAGIGVPNNATQITNANLQDLRVISNDASLKTLCTLTSASNTTIPVGSEVTLAWDAPSQANDIYRFYAFNNYIQPRVSAFYNVQSQITWSPASSTTKPIIFGVYMVDNVTFEQTQIYQVASAQTQAGDVSFTMNKTLKIPQSYYVYMSVKNTSNQVVTVKSVANTSPLLRVQFSIYPPPAVFY